MEKSSFISVLKTIEARLRDCHVITREDFTKILSGDYKSCDIHELQLLIDILFEEHTRLTSLVNDVNDLRSAVSKFDL